MSAYRPPSTAALAATAPGGDQIGPGNTNNGETNPLYAQHPGTPAVPRPPGTTPAPAPGTTPTPTTPPRPPGTTPAPGTPGAPAAGIPGTAAGTTGLATSYTDANGEVHYTTQANTNAALRGVTDQELVENRLGDLLSSDSRYIKDARLRGREAASKNGMLMSSVSAGMSERAAIEAGLPIASQDAAAFGSAAKDNQGFLNADRQADQTNRAQLLSQDIGIKANAAEAATQRSFASDQATRDKQFAAYQSQMAQTWQGTQNDLQRAQERNMAYYQTMLGRESALSNSLAAIYSNTTITAAQQQAAAANAVSVQTSLWSTMNATMSQGIPDIFGSPQPIP